MGEKEEEVIRWLLPFFFGPIGVEYHPCPRYSCGFKKGNSF